MKLEDVLARLTRHDPPYDHETYDDWAASILATPEGKALAALVEAAVDWHGAQDPYRQGRNPFDEPLSDAVTQYLRLGDVA
jgi:hypothetical protein